MSDQAKEILADLESLNSTIKGESQQLESSIAQVDKYQLEVQQLRQQIVQVEQELRAVMAPTHLPHDRDQAARDQQVGLFLTMTHLRVRFRFSCECRRTK